MLYAKATKRSPPPCDPTLKVMGFTGLFGKQSHDTLLLYKTLVNDIILCYHHAFYNKQE